MMQISFIFGNTGFVYRKTLEICEICGQTEPVYELTPKTDWQSLWRKVEELGILTLPDSSTLPNEVGVCDGISYVVEVNDGGRYRTYRYSNPQSQIWPEAEKIIAIIKAFDDEFKHQLPTNRMSWGYWK